MLVCGVLLALTYWRGKRRNGSDADRPPRIVLRDVIEADVSANDHRGRGQFLIGGTKRQDHAKGKPVPGQMSSIAFKGTGIANNAGRAAAVIEGPHDVAFEGVRFGRNQGPDIDASGGPRVTVRGSHFADTPSPVKPRTRGSSVGWSPGYALPWLKNSRAD